MLVTYQGDTQKRNLKTDCSLMAPKAGLGLSTLLLGVTATTPKPNRVSSEGVKETASSSDSFYK